MSESYRNHPICIRCVKKTHLGILNYAGDIIYISQCDKCHHYYKRLKGEEGVTHIEMDDAKELLDDRIACPLCEQHTKHKIKAKKKKIIGDNHKDFIYKYVSSKGNSHRFLCKNHPLKKYNEYDFNFSPEYMKLTLKDFFVSIKIFFEIEKHELDERSVLIFLTTINMPKTIIAKILNKSRPTIDKLIKENISSQEVKYRYEKIVNISSKGSKSFFETVIKIPRITLDDVEDSVEIKKKKILFNP